VADWYTKNECIGAGASPPTIGGLKVTCRTDTGAVLLNEQATSRACYESSPYLTGDFGPSPLSIISLRANQPTEGDKGYTNGVTLTVTFSGITNRGGFAGAGEAGGTLYVQDLHRIFSFSAGLGQIPTPIPSIPHPQIPVTQIMR
jgi:hypothetical protein